MRKLGAGRPVRVGGIDYLNALPLTRYLRGGDGLPLVITNHPPSLLAEKLRKGDLDIALVPVVEYLASADYRIVPGIGISSFGEVRSIRLFHRVPLNEARRVGLDRSSRSSALLTRLLFRDLWGGAPEFVQVASSDAQGHLENGAGLDAVLIIGDGALTSWAAPGWEALDLGTVWTRWTGLPFVYAFWVWRGGTPPAGLVERFGQAKAVGIARVDEISRATPLPRGFDEAACRHYLHRVIQYDLGPLQIEGLLEFFGRIQTARLCGGGSGPVEMPVLRWLEESLLAPAS